MGCYVVQPLRLRKVGLSWTTGKGGFLVKQSNLKLIYNSFVKGNCWKTSNTSIRTYLSKETVHCEAGFVSSRRVVQVRDRVSIRSPYQSYRFTKPNTNMQELNRHRTQSSRYSAKRFVLVYVVSSLPWSVTSYRTVGSHDADPWVPPAPRPLP